MEENENFRRREMLKEAVCNDLGKFKYLVSSFNRSRPPPADASPISNDFRTWTRRADLPMSAPRVALAPRPVIGKSNCEGRKKD